MKYIYFQRIRLLKNKIAAELRNNTNLTRNYKLFAIDVLPTPRIGHDISLNYRFGFCSIGPDIQS